MEAQRSDVVLGIDLGSTNTVAAAFLDDDVVVLENDVGSRLTPSCVRLFSATDSTVEERAVGKAALLHSVADPQGTIRNVKSILGCAFEDIGRSRPPLGPVKVARSESGAGAVIQLGNVVVTPEEVTSLLLANVKQCAERQLEKKIKDAVIAVPAFFNAARRQAVKDAAFLAGLQVRHLVNETSAAAAAFATQDELRTIVVVDIGGGGSCVSVAKCSRQRGVRVLATSGRRLPGGEDFDAKMVDYCIGLVKQIHGVEVRGARSREVIRSEWEETKKKLWGVPSAAATLYLPDENLYFHWRVRRADFEEQCGPLFQAIVDQVQPTLDQAKVAVHAVDDLVLVGASSRVKRLRALLEARLGRPVCTALNPDEAVARGAALLGARRVKLCDVTASELVVLSEGKKVPVKCNDPVPLEWTSRVKLLKPVVVRQGLGDEFVTILETKKDADCDVFGFRIDGSGCVALLDEREAPIKMAPRGCLSDEACQELLAKAKTRLRLDQEEELRVKTKNSLHGLCRSILNKLQDPEETDAVLITLESRLRGFCQDLLPWLESHPNAPQGELGEWLVVLESKQRASQQRRQVLQEELRSKPEDELRLKQGEEMRLKQGEEMLLKQMEELLLKRQEEIRLKLQEEMRVKQQQETRMRQQQQQGTWMQQQQESWTQQQQGTWMRQQQESWTQQQQGTWMRQQQESWTQQQQGTWMRQQQGTGMHQQKETWMRQQQGTGMHQQQETWMRQQQQQGTRMQQQQQEPWMQQHQQETWMRQQQQQGTWMQQQQQGTWKPRAHDVFGMHPWQQETSTPLVQQNVCLHQLQEEWRIRQMQEEITELKDTLKKACLDCWHSLYRRY